MQNLVGESDWTDFVDATTGIEPTRPGFLTFDATSRTTIDLSWLPLTGADTGGSDQNTLTIVGYNLYRDNGLGGPMQLIATIAGASNSFRVEYLKAGLPYRFQL